MVPSDYRLPSIANGLIARLEGTRRTYTGDPDAAEREFQRIATTHVQAAMAELADLGVVDEVESHAQFLEQEVNQTFLPRYTRLAIRMNAQEDGGFGMGPLASPIGRAGLFLVAVFGLVMFLRLIYLPWAWPLFLLDLSLPLWPDIVRALYRRRYTTQLQVLLDDLGSVQEQATMFAPTPISDSEPKPRPRQREVQ